ncbi:MAG: DUF3795 domain-containing protein [Bacillota bacterium]|nr:DUF3795 domain-containing protein [Bacillota bacterium]
MQAGYDSYCGLYCGACGTLSATEKGGTDASGERCMGCKSDLLARGCKEKCRMRPCAVSRGLDSCGDCAEFPCAILLAFERDGVAHHNAVVRNLNLLRRADKEAWLEAQRTRWSCAKCGEKLSWKQETCVRCGDGLYNSLKEARDASTTT